MDFGASLELNQKQTLKLAPAQIQAVEILQMSSVELKERINAELLSNPVLEIDESNHESYNYESAESLEYAEDRYDDTDRWDGSWADAGVVSREYRGSGASDFEKYMHSELTLHEHLINQLVGAKCSEAVRDAAEIIVYSIDSSGYLENDVSEIADIHGIAYDIAEKALRLVRKFDPAGIGSSNLQECLKSQIDISESLYEQMCMVIDSMLNDVAKGDIRGIARKTGVTSAQAQQMCARIRGLEPKPGMRFSDGSAVQYVVPDVMVELNHGKAYIHLYGSQPKLSINDYYLRMYESSDNGEVKEYLKDRIGSAEHMIDSIERRNATIVNVTRSILEHQEQFLNYGNRILLPLTMQDIADDLGIHVSTVSRAVNGKYIMLAGSTYSMKYFFSNDVNGSSREEVVSEMLKIITEEDPGKPLSDQKITDLLISKGFDISRRTVAKYREKEGILPKSMRKQ